jgi:hypothetical protein
MKNIQIYDRIWLKHPERNLAIEYVDSLEYNQPDKGADCWRLIDLETKEVAYESVVLHDVVRKASCIQRIRLAKQREDYPIETIQIQNNPEEAEYNSFLGKECWKAISSNVIHVGNVEKLRKINGWLEANVKWYSKGGFITSDRQSHTTWERVANLSFDRPLFKENSNHEFVDCQGIENDDCNIRDVD